MARKFLTGIDLNGQKATGLAAGTSATDAVTKAQLDNAVAGLNWKQAVRVASTAAASLTTFSAGNVVDGYTLVAGDRILIKDQTSKPSNGIYVVGANGVAPTRATDADQSSEYQSATVAVIAGSANKDTFWTQTTDDPTIGTSDLVFMQTGGSSGGGTTYTAGNGVSIAGAVISAVVKTGGGLIVDSTGLSIDPAYTGAAKRYAVTLAANQTTVTHNLGTQDVLVAIYDVTSTPVEVEADVTITSANAISLGFATAPVASQYRVVVIG